MRRLIDNGNATPAKPPYIGHYGRLRKAYLENYRPDLYAAFAANPYVNLVLAGMQAGVAAVIFDVVASLARDIFKTGDWLYILLMVLAFAASFYINVVYIILIAAAVGIAQGLILGKKEGKL